MFFRYNLIINADVLFVVLCEKCFTFCVSRAHSHGRHHTLVAANDTCGLKTQQSSHIVWAIFETRPPKYRLKMHVISRSPLLSDVWMCTHILVTSDQTVFYIVYKSLCCSSRLNKYSDWLYVIWLWAITGALTSRHITPQLNSAKAVKFLHAPTVPCVLTAL